MSTIRPAAKTLPSKRTIDATTSPNGPYEGEDDNQPKPSKKRRVPVPSHNYTTTSDEDTTGRDESDEDSDASSSPHEDNHRDIDNFYQSPVMKTIDSGNMKEYRICKLCPGKKGLVNQVTTLRRHLEVHHLVKYRKWARSTKYESNLPVDIKKREAVRVILTRMMDNIREKQLTEDPVVPYTDEAFRRAAIEWLVVTNQPLNAFENPHLRRMINLVAGAAYVPGPSNVDTSRI